MFCDRCGTQVLETQSFCPTCGKAFRPAPVAPVSCRVAGNVRVLGGLWLAYSALRLMGGWFLAVLAPRFFLWPLGRPMRFPFVFGGFLRASGFLLMGTAVLGLLAGWGLLERHPWARMLAIVMAFLALPSLPFGTALGLYTLWVLLPAEAEREYRQISHPV